MGRFCHTLCTQLALSVATAESEIALIVRGMRKVHDEGLFPALAPLLSKITSYKAVPLVTLYCYCKHKGSLQRKAVLLFLPGMCYSDESCCML